MRNYDYRDKWKKLLTPEIVSMLTQIHEYKGEQSLFIEARADTLEQLMEIAKIQSTEASNKIEGIYTSDERLAALVKNKTRPKTRNEQEIAGYRDVLNTIHESYEHIPPLGGGGGGGGGGAKLCSKGGGGGGGEGAPNTHT